MAEPAGAGRHHAAVLLLRGGLRQHHLRVHHPAVRHRARGLSAVACGDAAGPEFPADGRWRHSVGRLDGYGDALEGDGGRPQPAEGLSETVIQEIGKLLHDRCEGNKLYLQTDLTSVQLAQALGTNRTYLGMYFSSQGTTYNAYINTLRINYFIELCRQASAAAEGQSIQAKQLANRSGYRSYRTFSVAFKQRTGQSVKDWIAEQESALQSNKE